MANALYDKGREGFLGADIDWNGNKIKAYLVDTASYSVNLATHEFLSSIPSGARIAQSAFLTSKTIAAGVADAADVTFTAVTGASVEAIVLVRAAALDGDADLADTAQRLIAYYDTATGLPVTPNGGDIVVTWDNGANKIFKL